MPNLLRDVRIVAKALGARPGATIAAVLILALGMGANTAIFSVFNALVLRSLPVPHPEQLVSLGTTIADSVNGAQSFTLPMFDELERRNEVFSHLFVSNDGRISNFEANGRHYAAALASVSGSYYQAVQITPLLGRFIQRDDVSLRAGVSKSVAVISYRAWRGWYRSDPNILGKTIRVDGQPLTIIGVEPESYTGLLLDGSADVTVPLFTPGHIASADNFRGPMLLWLTVYGRLKPGVTLAQARTAVQTLWPHILEATAPPGYEGERRTRFFARRIVLESAARGVSFIRNRFSYSLRLLLALAGTVLLIACFNLANLSLARAAARQHETGVRTALGAGTWDLIQGPLIESILLAILGALLGLAFAHWIGQAILHMLWTGLVENALATTPDLRVLAFTAAVALATGLIFGGAPAWYATRMDPAEALKKQSRSVRGSAAGLRRVLLVAQIALSLVLLVGASLFGQTLVNLHTSNAGYERDHLLTMLLFPQPGREATENSSAYYRELTAKLESLPGVAGVSFSNMGPANELEYFDSVRRSPASAAVQAVDEFAGPEFFHVVGMRVLSGREFTWTDDERHSNSAVISQSLAERLFPHESAIGRTVYVGPLAHLQAVTVVGIVNSASLWKIRSVRPLAIYRPLWAKFKDIQPLVDIRTTVDPKSIKTGAEHVVQELGHHYSLRTMTINERLDTFISEQRVTALLTSIFAGVALSIAAIGLYGLMSFHVATRQSELGIRIAIGARSSQMVALVLREVFLLAIAGCLLGFFASMAAGKVIRGLLFGTSATNWIVFAATVSVLFLIALAAGFIPALRAARINPVEALRAE